MFWNGAPLRKHQSLPLELRSDEDKAYSITVKAPPLHSVEEIRVNVNVESAYVDAVCPQSVRPGKSSTISLRVHGRELFSAPADIERITASISYTLARRFD